MASELSNNVCDFTETNKKIFFQYEAESALSVEESSESVIVIPPPQRFVTNEQKGKLPTTETKYFTRSRETVQCYC